MNLVQIQERLKEMPTQAVMAYANGMNPDVPPYLALGELNRRKRMEQTGPGQMPQGTVKEQIEGEIGARDMQQQAMQTQVAEGMQQQRAAQQMLQRLAQSAQPPVQMAGGGVAQLNVPDDVVMYGSGGIVAFAKGGDEGEELTDEEIEKAKRPYVGTSKAAPKRPEVERDFGEMARRAVGDFGEMARRGVESFGRFMVPEYPAERQRGPQLPRGIEGARRYVEPPPAMANFDSPQWQKFFSDVMASPNISEEQKRMVIADARRTGGPAPTANFVPMGAPQAAPQGIAQVAPQPAARPTEPMGPSYFQSQLAGMATPGQTYEQKLEAAAAKDPYLKKQPGELLEEYIKRMEAREGEEKSRFEQTEKDRARAALWKSLIAAGEATRGRQGIGALFGGFGRAAGEEMEAARGREEAFAKGRREREDAIMKMRQEIESARIARSQGRFKEANEHDQKAEEARRRAVEKGAEIEAAEQREERRFARDVELKGIPQATKLTLQEQLVDAITKGDKPRAAAIRDALTVGATTRGQMTWDQALDNARQEIKDPTMWQAMENAAAKREGRQPRKVEQAIMERAQQLMQGSQGIGGLPAQTTLPPGVKVTRER